MGINLFWNVVFISALSQSIFVVAILILQYIKAKQLSQFFLGSFLFVFSFILFNNMLYWNKMFGEYPFFILSTVSIRFLLVPFFYFYCRTFYSDKIEIKTILHLLPFLILTIIYWRFLILSGQEKMEMMAAVGESSSSLYVLLGKSLNWLLSIQLIAYPILIYSELKRYLETHKNNMDENKERQLKWVKFLNHLFLLYGILMLSYFILVAFQVGGIEKDFYISAVMCIAIYSISYVGMTSPNLLKGEKFLERIQNFKYGKTRLEEKQLEEIIAKLESYMQTEKIFVDADIGLDQVAEKMDLPKHYISQALSLRLDKTFHQYINKYRVEHALELLKNLSEEDNIKTVMYASGFNNRASFNNNFKKITGMTATEFLKKGKSGVK